MLSALTKFLIIMNQILTRSTLAAGIVQDTFAGEGEGGEEETGCNGNHFSSLVLTHAMEPHIFVGLAQALGRW